MAKTADRRKHIRKGPPPLWRARDQLQAGRIKWPRRPLVLVDLDGTLTNPERRLHYVQGPRRPDTETKTEIVRDLLRHVPKEKILFAVDDRPSVVEEVWRKNGIRVFPMRASDNAGY